ncbi:DegT/DnrJ/EryC1/StrS aminotransferase family protein [Algoriphagus sp. Y33]|uniref:DegT/DnrJ/EryC1/StrS family aminotransferase n=1 Tax=Algoriphagus sp. Y33 TaxID=2772483 RepID=UPI001CE152DF|nr:DegT/DnrJ/EryC1/StrS family aminotransferase [Algoriphagus sp. Y33]
MSEKINGISMVDLRGQYEKIKLKIDTAIQEVIDQSTFIKGPVVQSFQTELQDYLNVQGVVTCGNGTDALQIALMGLDLSPGDEVITAAFTYPATAEVIVLLGLVPVLVDVDPETFLINPDLIEAAITYKTKVILPVHLFGQCADMERILAIATMHKLFVIEDVAQAMGAEYHFTDGSIAKAGTMGDIGCTSFFPSKNLGCFGDGGALFSNDKALCNKLRMIANHGQSVQYFHDVVGVNSRLDAIQAAILRVKLPYLDSYNIARQLAADYYDRELKESEFLRTPKRAGNGSHVFHQYTLLITGGVDRDKLRSRLADKGVPTMIYYPLPIHQQQAYRSDRNSVGQFPVAESLPSRVLSLPIHTEMTQEQLDYIVSLLKEELAGN